MFKTAILQQPADMALHVAADMACGQTWDNPGTGLLNNCQSFNPHKVELPTSVAAPPIKGVVLHDGNTPVFEPMTGSLGNHLIHQPSAGFGQ
jgi:hypothetical protein